MNTRTYFKNRRLFLQQSLALAGLPLIPKISSAQSLPTITNPILANIILDGGPDFRHLLVPEYNSDPNSYGYTYWAHRYNAHGIGSTPAAWAARFSSGYDLVVSGGVRFGILKKAAWLKSMWDQGQVAIVNNVLASTNRDHNHSSVIYDSGDLNAAKGQVAREGWGGRLAVGLNANVVSVSRNVKQFCFGPDLLNPDSHSIDRIISAADSRNLGLYQSAAKIASAKSSNSQAIMDRSLSAYYAAKTLPAGHKHEAFKAHEQKLRTFGELVNSRLNQFSLPSSLSQLGQSSSGSASDGSLTNTGFATQIRNLYDCLLCHDLLNMRIAALNYGGWDTHKNQATDIEANFQDLFGTGKSLDVLYSALSSNFSSAANKLVFVLGGEFGRQLGANGGGGTDHGRGMTMILIGKEVRGGIYGEMFPATEIANSSNGYLKNNSDILGKTSLFYLLAKVCDKLQAGQGSQVFSQLAQAQMESPGLLDSLFV